MVPCKSFSSGTRAAAFINRHAWRSVLLPPVAACSTRIDPAASCLNDLHVHRNEPNPPKELSTKIWSHIGRISSHVVLCYPGRPGCKAKARGCVCTACLVSVCKVGGVTWGVRILIKNKLQNPSINHETNLLSLINLSLAHVLL
jgi:hypothetical protein